MKRILPLILLVTTFMASAQSDTVMLTTAIGELSGSLLVPNTSKNQCPIVLIIAGSGPTDRDGNSAMMGGKNNSLKLLAEGLAEEGIASLRYDKRGLGLSKSAFIQESDLRFDHFVEDAQAWIQLLQQDKRFSEVIVAGHSEGSLIGMIATKKAKADRFISIAGAGKKADLLLREQLATQPKFIKNEAFRALDSLVIGKTVDDINPMLASLFRPSVQPYLISWFKQDPQAIIKGLAMPVLIVQGTTDIQVSVKDAELLKEANTRVHLVMIEGMNHVLKKASADKMENMATYGNPTLSLKEELIPAILHFIKK